MVSAVPMELDAETADCSLNFRGIITVAQILRFVLYRQVAESSKAFGEVRRATPRPYILVLLQIIVEQAKSAYCRSDEFFKEC